jgi:pyruvate-ferredoxin/flavodoxin oxidoreductase
LPADERGGRFPYIWATDSQGRLMRLVVAEELVRGSEERLQFWLQLRDLTSQPMVDETAVAERVRADLMQRIGASLGLAGVMSATTAVAAAGAASAAPQPAASGAAADYEPCWVESPECSACDECIKLAPGVFAYNAQRKAIVVNPKGAKYADIVKCAEKCTAGCLHPGTPWNMSEPGLDKLRARAAKFN